MERRGALVGSLQARGGRRALRRAPTRLTTCGGRGRDLTHRGRRPVCTESVSCVRACSSVRAARRRARRRTAKECRTSTRARPTSSRCRRSMDRATTPLPWDDDRRGGSSMVVTTRDGGARSVTRHTTLLSARHPLASHRGGGGSAVWYLSSSSRHHPDPPTLVRTRQPPARSSPHTREALDLATAAGAALVSLEVH